MRKDGVRELVHGDLMSPRPEMALQNCPTLRQGGAPCLPVNQSLDMVDGSQERV